MCKLTTLLSPPILNMQHSLQATGVLAVVQKYPLSVSMILRYQNGATLPPPFLVGKRVWRTCKSLVACQRALYMVWHAGNGVGDVKVHGVP